MKHQEFINQAEKAVRYQELKVTSAVFEDGGEIPLRYTCDGENVNPPLTIGHIPKEAICLVILVEDIDAPVRPWTHWLAWNIPVTHHIRENQVHGTEGLNDFECLHYTGPCPNSGTHRYTFKIYALDTLLDMPYRTGKFRLEKEMSGHVIAFGELSATYTKKEKHFPDRVM